MEWGEDGSHKPLSYALTIKLLSGTMKRDEQIQIEGTSCELGDMKLSQC